MRFHTLLILLAFLLQQITLPVSVFQASSGICYGNEMMAQTNQPSDLSAKVTPANGEHAASYENAASSSKDILTTGVSLTQNLQSPNFVFSEFMLSSETLLRSTGSSSLQSRTIPIDHPPQISLASY